MNRVHECINGGQAVFFRDIGEISITCSGYGTGMTKNGLDMTKA